MSDEPDYEVGYRKPPKAHRFQKGKSGNPKGRPRKLAAARPAAKSRSIVGAEEAKALLIEEAYRPVTIREGEKTITLPAIQAVFRAISVSALKGNRFAQRTMADLVQQVETEDREAHARLFEAAVEYKHDWGQAIAQARHRGLPEPTPLPHPEDVYIDARTTAVHILGPRTPEEKAEYDERLKCRDEAQREVSLLATKYRRARDPQVKQQWLNWWHHEQRIFDVINDNLPPRYRTTLDHRSYAPDASREGDQKRVEWPNDKTTRRRRRLR